MELIPAIDLLHGKVVRLHQGDYEQVTVFAEDALALARGFEAAGATRLHVVDLEAARRGTAAHADTIRAVVEGTGLKVQVGGGVRTAETARAWLDVGVDRVVIGTAAVKTPDWVEALAAERGDAVVIAIDARQGEVAVEGWLESAGLDAPTLARRVDAWGVGAILFTAIERDGTSAGPDVGATAALQAEVRATVIASGGIGGLEHIARLREGGVRSTVCGRAILSGAISVQDALAEARGA